MSDRFDSENLSDVFNQGPYLSVHVFKKGKLFIDHSQFESYFIFSCKP